jgi:hypothetical protein
LLALTVNILLVLVTSTALLAPVDKRVTELCLALALLLAVTAPMVIGPLLAPPLALLALLVAMLTAMLPRPLVSARPALASTAKLPNGPVLELLPALNAKLAGLMMVLSPLLAAPA